MGQQGSGNPEEQRTFYDVYHRAVPSAVRRSKSSYDSSFHAIHQARYVPDQHGESSCLRRDDFFLQGPLSPLSGKVQQALKAVPPHRMRDVVVYDSGCSTTTFNDKKWFKSLEPLPQPSSSLFEWEYYPVNLRWNSELRHCSFQRHSGDNRTWLLSLSAVVPLQLDFLP